MTDEARTELRRYYVGALASAALTLAAFLCVTGLPWSRTATIWTTGALGIVQIAVQLRCFLHFGWRGRRREDAQLIAFSLLLLAVMAGGTIWIMSSLHGRMG